MWQVSVGVVEVGRRWHCGKAAALEDWRRVFGGGAALLWQALTRHCGSTAALPAARLHCLQTGTAHLPVSVPSSSGFL